MHPVLGVERITSRSLHSDMEMVVLSLEQWYLPRKTQHRVAVNQDLDEQRLVRVYKRRDLSTKPVFALGTVAHIDVWSTKMVLIHAQRFNQIMATTYEAIKTWQICHPFKSEAMTRRFRTTNV